MKFRPTLYCYVAGWEEYLDEDGDVFYYDTINDKSTYEHPCDAYFKWMYGALKEQTLVSTPKYCSMAK